MALGEGRRGDGLGAVVLGFKEEIGGNGCGMWKVMAIFVVWSTSRSSGNSLNDGKIIVNT